MATVPKLTKATVPKPSEAKAAAPSAAPAPSVPVVTLLVDSINARGLKCPAGTVIAPDVDGWPVHRVQRHLRDKLAR